jgi:SAM-dependent methyltransferase
MSRKPAQDPWGDFWALNAPRGGAVGGGNGCLPQRWAAIERELSAQWKSFAQTITQDAAVLDLATGDGRVMTWLREARPDLTCTGIDLAPTLPPPPAGTQTRAGVAMEALPFDAGSMGAVVSQFGFEYGDVPKVAAEIARVLAAGGRVGLIVHRGDGPILEHNRQRRTELMWALKEKGTARKVRSALKGGPEAIDKAAGLVGRIAEQGAKRFGQSSPAWEIPEAIRRSCIMGRNHGIESILDTIATIEGHAMNEIGRINSLAGACATADKRGVIEKAFGTHGLKPDETVALSEPSGRAFADFLSFI